MKYNDRLRELREDNDLTQTQIANKFNVKQITISQYERGTRQVSLDILVKYAEYFNVSTDYILGLTNNPTPNYNIKNQVNIKGGKNKIEMR
ncbi:MAG: helix-turn-helix transcriptional regulator [Ruminococcus sp.]|nr:helix-turn-helix transcriptional regulator [Ruminococcus sp.]